MRIDIENIYPGAWGVLLGICIGIVLASSFILPFKPRGERISEPCRKLSEVILRAQDNAAKVRLDEY